jgi:hypothetical protein
MNFLTLRPLGPALLEANPRGSRLCRPLSTDGMLSEIRLLRFLIADGECVAEFDGISTRTDFLDEVRKAAPESIFANVVELGGLLDANFAPKRKISGKPISDRRHLCLTKWHEIARAARKVALFNFRK